MLAALFAALLSAAPTDGAAIMPVGLQQLRIRNYRPMGLAISEIILLRVALEGPAVKEAFRYGAIVVAEAKDDAGNDLRITAGSVGSVTDKPGPYLLSKPERATGSALFDLRLKPPAAGCKSYSVRGTAELHSIEGRVNADFAKFNPAEEQELKHAELDAAGLKVKVVKRTAKDETLVVLHIEGDEGKLDGFELVDAGGKAAKAASVKVLKGAKAESAKDRYIQFPEKLGADITLRIVVLKGLKTRVVPFAFEKLELP